MCVINRGIMVRVKEKQAENMAAGENISPPLAVARTQSEVVSDLITRCGAWVLSYSFSPDASHVV